MCSPCDVELELPDDGRTRLRTEGRILDDLQVGLQLDGGRELQGVKGLDARLDARCDFPCLDAELYSLSKLV